MNRPLLDWIRESVLQQLSSADRAIATIELDDDDEGSSCEPWIDLLLERRRMLQTTLSELEQEIRQLSA